MLSRFGNIDMSVLFLFSVANYHDTVIFSVATLIGQNAIEPFSMSRASPCPACILRRTGRRLYPRAEVLILLLGR